MKFRTVLWQALRLRCPVCGQGKLFRGWLRMAVRCEQCGYKYERAPGYFLGSIYINYALTAILVTSGYMGIWVTGRIDPDVLLWIAAVFVLLFPMLFFRWARSLWMAMDQWFDPAAEQESGDPPSG